MTGEPKSGTTWLEYVLKRLCMEACAQRLQYCDCTLRKAKRHRNHLHFSSKELGHSLLTMVGFERRASNMRNVFYKLQPRKPSSSSARAVYFTQAVTSKHSIPGLNYSLSTATISFKAACIKHMDSACLRSLGSPSDVLTNVVQSPQNAKQLLIVRDPRHLVLSWCVFNMQLRSYDACIRNDLPKRARNVALRYAWHSTVLSQSSHIVLYNDLVHDFNTTLIDICRFAEIKESVCTDTQLIARISKQVSKQEMARIERGQKGRHEAIPGSNRPGWGTKVSSEKVKDRTQMLSPDAAMEAKRLLQRELPDQLLSRLVDTPS